MQLSWFKWQEAKQKGEVKRAGERQTDKDRDRDRERNRQAERETKGETERERHTGREREREREMEREGERAHCSQGSSLPIPEALVRMYRISLLAPRMWSFSTMVRVTAFTYTAYCVQGFSPCSKMPGSMSLLEGRSTSTMFQLLEPHAS